MSTSRSHVRERWQAETVAASYDSVRWSRRAQRDPRAVARLLARHLDPHSRRTPLLLDVPCGTGRLREAIEAHGRVYGLDVSAAMLAGARERDPTHLLRGDVEALPFRDRGFDAVVTCRLLHHLLDPDSLRAAVQELVRVSADLVLASFWDRASLEAARRRFGLARRPRHRGWHRKQELEAVFEEAGARVIAYEHGIRFVSQQTWLVARRLGGESP